ncbi:MAG: hypothetical protein ACHQ51_10030 [Elusimicrobiota bacterium]
MKALALALAAALSVASYAAADDASPGSTANCRLVSDAFGKVTAVVKSGYRTGTGMHAWYFSQVLNYDKQELAAIDRLAQYLPQVKSNGGNGTPVDCSGALSALDPLRKALVDVATLEQNAVAPCTKLNYFDGATCPDAAYKTFDAREALAKGPLADFHAALVSGPPECNLRNEDGTQPLAELNVLPCAAEPALCRNLPLTQAADQMKSAWYDDISNLSREPIRSAARQVLPTLHESEMDFRNLYAHPAKTGDRALFEAVADAMATAGMLDTTYTNVCSLPSGAPPLVGGTPAPISLPGRPANPTPHAPAPPTPVAASQPVPPRLPPPPPQPTSYPPPTQPQQCGSDGCPILPRDQLLQ